MLNSKPGKLTGSTLRNQGAYVVRFYQSVFITTGPQSHWCKLGFLFKNLTLNNIYNILCENSRTLKNLNFRAKVTIVTCFNTRNLNFRAKFLHLLQNWVSNLNFREEAIFEQIWLFCITVHERSSLWSYAKFQIAVVQCWGGLNEIFIIRVFLYKSIDRYDILISLLFSIACRSAKKYAYENLITRETQFEKPEEEDDEDDDVPVLPEPVKSTSSKTESKSIFDFFIFTLKDQRLREFLEWKLQFHENFGFIQINEKTWILRFFVPKANV